MVDFIKELVGVLKGPYFWLALIVGGLIYFGSTDLYKTRFKFPQWSGMVIENENPDIETMELVADIELQKGSIIVTPKIEVRYKGKIFFIVNIEGLHNINTASIENRDGQSRFCLEMDKQQNEKLNELRKEFINLLEEFLEGTDKHKIEDCTVQYSLLAEISFQNKGANKSKTRFYKITDAEIRMIQEKEKVLLGTEYFWNLDQIDSKQSLYTNTEVIEIIKECAKRLGNKDE